MAGEFGLSFSPTGKDDQQQAGANQTPIQDAIKVLSLRIPQFHGGIAPQQLLGGPGSAGLPGGGAPGVGGIPGGLDEFLRRLFGMGGGMPGGMPGGPMAGPPTPSVRPGGEPGQMPVPPEPAPQIGGVVPPGSFSPSPSSGRPSPIFGAKPPMQQLP